LNQEKLLAGLALLEDHLEKKHLEHLEKEKQKLGDLENEFADLKINGGDGSFRYMKKINDSETAFDAERLKQSQRELNREDLENANTVSFVRPCFCIYWQLIHLQHKKK